MIFVSLSLLAAGLTPFYLAFVFWRARHDSQLNWLLAFSGLAAFSLLLFLIGPWFMIGFYLRPLVLAAPAVAGYLSFRRLDRHSSWPPGNWRAWTKTVFFAAGMVALVVAHVAAWAGRIPGETPVELQFPLRAGTYAVGQGGSTKIVNRHHPVRMQRYALDMTKLNIAGMSAWWIVPAELSRHAIYGETVVSPCAGQVAEVVDGLPDLIPPATDRKNSRGNCVVLRCRNPAVDVLLAHLQPGSIPVSKNESVEGGQPLGWVGNSGNTSWPHLHLEASRNGEGVPMTFGGRFLVRNSRISMD